MSLQLCHIRTLDQLCPGDIAQWETLSKPSPMASPRWLINWWNAFGRSTGDQLCLLLLHDGDELVAVAPWYIRPDWTGGRCLRFLGDGLVCTDHSTVLAKPGCELAARRALLPWLESNVGAVWNTIRFESIDKDDRIVPELVQGLSAVTLEPHQRQVAGTWFVDLPSSWEGYLRALSKNHRKRCRRWKATYFDTGRAVVKRISTQDFRPAWQEIVRLNLQRREHLGDRSAFVDERFCQFHERALPRLLKSGRVELRQLHLDGQLVASEYVLLSEDSVFCYQSGMETSQQRDGYGNLSLLALFHDAIEAGKRRVDFLRGDEPYKLHWGAQPRPCLDYFATTKSAAGIVQLASYRAVNTARAIKSVMTGA